jgi:hypothetical protein
VPLEFRGVHQEIYCDRTREIDAEGALSSGKTTLALAKELDFLLHDKGIHSFMFRYSDTDTKTKLKSAFEEVCMFQGVTSPKWNNSEMCYDFENGSKLYAFGLKSPDRLSRYSKLRGLGVSRIYSDQSEEVPADIANELRARLRQRGHEHQLTLTPNPTNTRSWIATQFPVDNSIKGRHYYALSLYDNSHNLKAETIAGLELAFPVEHAKHDVVIMGQRGENVIGDAIYENTFARRLHIRPLVYEPSSPLLEAFDFGKHHPCYVVAQQQYAGGLKFLAGIIGENLFLEDFIPVVKQQRALWFPGLQPQSVKTCCTASSIKQQVGRFTGINLLREAGFKPMYREDGNSPDVVVAVIERLAAYMRRRSLGGDESLGVNIDKEHWLKASKEGIEPCQFIAQGFESGYVWDEHMISVGSNEVRQPHSDDWFEHGMRCAEAIELNFGAEQMTQAERDRRKSGVRARTNATAGQTIMGGKAPWMV